MWACLMGIKCYMTTDEEMKGTPYKEHKPGFTIKENSIKYWCDNLACFSGWEKYVPDPYIKKIKTQAKIDDVEKRDYICFDSKYLLSVRSYLLSINFCRSSEALMKRPTPRSSEKSSPCAKLA